MNETKTTLYERLGGKEAIAKVVDHFYDNVLADDKVNGYFENTDMKKQRQHQTLFITFATGGPNEYKGLDMKKAHEGLGIDDEAFDRIVYHLTNALKHYNVKEEDIQEVAEKLAPLKEDIVER